jgi:hypothetical protein
MQMRDVEPHQGENDGSEAGGVDEEARRGAKGHDQKAAHHGADHTPGCNHGVVEGHRVRQIRLADEVLHETEQCGLIDGEDKALQKRGKPDHPQFKQAGGHEAAEHGCKHCLGTLRRDQDAAAVGPVGNDASIQTEQ